MNITVSSPGVITRIEDALALSVADAERGVPVKATAIVTYCHPQWHMLFVQAGEMGTFLRIPISTPPMRPGDVIEVEGTTSSGHGYSEVHVDKLTSTGRRRALNAQNWDLVDILNGRASGQWLQVEGRVLAAYGRDGRLLIQVAVGATNITAYLLNWQPDLPTQLIDTRVRITGVLSVLYDNSGHRTGVAVLAQEPEQVEVLQAVATNPLDLPIIPVARLIAPKDGSVPQRFHIQGVLEQHSEGATLAVRDRTGSIQVQCSYKPNIALDAGVDAYGYPTMVDGELVLKDALIMPVGTPAKSRVTAEEMSNRPILPVLGAAQAIRRLDRTEAAKGYPVQLEAVVTYCDSRQWSLFVQDASGAVFVAATGKRIDVHAGERVRIKGVTGEGDFAPIISRATVEVLGEAPLPAPARVPLDALLTGQFDCRWVEIHGVVQSATEQEHRPWLQVMTAQGQLPAVLGPGISKSDAEQLLDARVTLRGVAGGQFNDQGQIIAVRLYVPNSGSILVDEAPPSHPFAVPAQKIADLSRYQPDQDIFRRVKICGRVTSVSPDDTISLQDDTGGMLVRVMRYDRMPHIGEEVEILGYPMADEFAITLKDAWSKIDGPGAEPAPLKITAEDVLSNQPNDQLVELEGSLIQDTTLRAGQILVLQAGPNVFDAVLPRTLQAGSDQQLVAGTRLRVAGVCTLEGGRWGQVRSFSLRVRDAGDLAVLSRPPWWNLRRLFMILAGTGVLGALALASNLLLAKKNRQLSVQIRERARAENELHRAHAALKEAHDSLEQRVAERTHELREQIAAKDKAHADLAAAQKDLMEASREAGMAEIATGVLHNVGNVLNSVNVSNTIIQEKLRRSEFLTLGKVRGLLKEHENDLPTFLTSDPKGKLVPGFIIKLADNIDKELSLLQEEHEQLTRNVGHIKEIVATQQTYARVSGSMESLAIATLVDDALQINSVGIGRNGIKVVREYEDVPHVTVDKHKVLQILVNLITNAKHALDESGRKDPQLTLKIARNGNSRLKVSVSDNGIGIAPENFPKVFSYGFTTRRTGHGFGLHSGVNTAREMGGELTAHSDGAGKGATFVLEIPLDDPSKN